MASTTPIADLRYRGYDGALESPRRRWLVIARMGWRQALKKRSYWVTTIASAWYYLMMLVIVFFVEQMTALSGKEHGVDAFLQRISWNAEFVTGFSFGQLLWMVLALILGAGAIANDNRANALLVYLSKPCSKRDYLVGKWVGMWAPLTLAMAIPTLFFYLYGALNFREYGFLGDPWLLPKLLVVLPLAAAVHTCLALGVSSLFNQGRMAGAAYAGLYILGSCFSKMMQVLWISSHLGSGPAIGAGDAVKNLYYGSIGTSLIGLAKVVIGTDGTPPFGSPAGPPQVARPAAWLLFGALALISAAALAVAWKRVRAVEVVK